jgi:hypothetical protein
VFPRRKELINQVSTLFIQDVNLFIEKSFSHEANVHALFHIKDEIKALQSAAKELTLNTEAFQESRKRLSECWDSVAKLLEKERKKETEEREEFKKIREEFQQSIETLQKKFEEKSISEKEALNQIDGLQNKLRGLSLGRHEQHALKEKIFHARDLFTARERHELELKKEALHKAEETKGKELEAIFKKVEDLFRAAEAHEADILQQEIEALQKEAEKAPFARSKKLEIQDLFVKLSDILFEKREKGFKPTSQEDIRKVLSERNKRKKEIQARLEQLRKSQGASRFDFTEALRTEELIKEEKEKLEKINEAIEELEDRLD